MFTALIFVCVLSLVSCFTPSAPIGARISTNSLIMAKEGFSRSLPFLLKPKNLDGMIGNAEFDPLGFAETFDVKWMREAEIKHGRVAMLATVGWLVQAAGIHLPGEAFTKSNPIDAAVAVGPGAFLQLVFFVGCMEFYNHDGKVTMDDMHTTDRAVGEFKAGIYGASRLKNKSDEYIADKKLKELQNGRLAMVAIGGMVHHQILGGSELFGAFPNPNIWQGLAVNLPDLYHY